MWKRTLDGRVLTFRLAGINNQNFIMRDEQTGSYWQQVSGKAISGPKGKGTIYVVAKKSAGEWSYSRMEVEVEGQPGRIDLLRPSVQ